MNLLSPSNREWLYSKSLSRTVIEHKAPLSSVSGLETSRSARTCLEEFYHIRND
jgi:hypothetical protein